MMRTLIICCCAVLVLSAEETPDQGTDWQALVQQVHREAEQLRKTDDPSKAVEEAGRAAAAPTLPGASATADSIRAELASMQSALLGRDVIQDVVQAKLVPGGGMDPTAGMTYDIGPGGLLWAFWATDAPGIEPLPNQLAQAQVAYPEMRIHDLHIMRLTDWHAMVKTLSQIKDEMERDDPFLDNATEIQRKREIAALRLPRYMAATEMAQTRRQGGHLLIEDMTAALAWSIANIPSFVYVSPRGVVHRIKGVNPDRPLAAWIAQCLAWEEQSRQIIADRLRAGP